MFDRAWLVPRSGHRLAFVNLCQEWLGPVPLASKRAGSALGDFKVAEHAAAQSGAPIAFEAGC